MEEGSVVTGAGNGKASDSRSLVVEIEMDNMPEDYGGGGSEKLMEASESGATRGIMEKRSCSSRWVVEMEKMLHTYDANPTVESAGWSGHSIYRVPQYMKNMTNSEAYSPQFVSLGPLHHGEPHLLPMEEHKCRAVAHIVKWSGKPLQDFVATIDEVADKLQAAYSDLDDRWLGSNKGRFVEMMVMDGCFLLAWFEGSQGTDNPVFSWRSYTTLYSTMKRDMIAMENQLPLVILQRLLAVRCGKFPTAREINNMVQYLLAVPRFDGSMDKLGLHFLDIFHRSYYYSTSPQSEGFDIYDPRTPCAVELAESGIQFKKSVTDSILDFDFKNGVLSMPLFQLHDSTEIYLLNLMAFERLHPGSNFYLTSYVSFLDKIIKSETDVALLRHQGLFENLVGSDKKAVEMFNILTMLAKTPMPGSKQGYVNWKVNCHFKKRRNKLLACFWNAYLRYKWRATFKNKYLSNPWVFMSMVGAIVLLVATLLQTIYTIVPFYTKG